MANLDLLLDTHLTLWFLDDSLRLPEEARALIQDSGNQVFFSAVMIWEIGIKAALGRPDFTYNASAVRRTLIAYGHRELTLTGLQAASLGALPMLHRDPFDRMLIAQALSEGLTLLTADKTVAKYPGRILLV